ncbi:MAG: hypothetical protein KC620_27115, partial [Myxococcales bacterium]|nr:hypothetical protein [Myxococcales bacterium]
MRNNSIFFVALAALVGLGACDDGGGTDQQVTLQPEAGIRDAFVETDGGRPDARPDTGAGGEGGMGGVGGMGGEGGQGGAGGGIRMLATCDDICGVYAD